MIAEHSKAYPRSHSASTRLLLAEFTQLSPERLNPAAALRDSAAGIYVQTGLLVSCRQKSYRRTPSRDIPAVDVQSICNEVMSHVLRGESRVASQDDGSDVTLRREWLIADHKDAGVLNPSSKPGVFVLGTPIHFGVVVARVVLGSVHVHSNTHRLP